MGKTKKSTVVIVTLLIIAAVFDLAIWSGKLSFDANGRPTGQATGSNDKNQQFAQIQPSVLINVKDSQNDTVLSGTGHAWVDGEKQVMTLGTAFDVEQGSNVEVFFDDGQHYAVQETGIVGPQNGKKTQSFEAQPNGTLTATFYNSAGTATTAQAIGADETKSVKVLLEGQNKKVYNNNKCGAPVMCFDYPTANISGVEVTNGGGSVDVPKIGQGTYEECYDLGVSSFVGTQSEIVKIDVTSDATNDPVGDVSYIVYDQDVYVATQATNGHNVGDRVCGFNDDVKADIGSNNPTGTLDLS